MGKIHLRGERPDLLVGAEGQPMPPASALVELAAIDERLSMKFFPIADDTAGCWCFTEAWGENDRRWSSVICGDVPRDKAYDIIGWAPRDMPGDDALGFLLAALQKGPGNKHDAHAYMHKIHEHTLAMRRAVVEDSLNAARESVIEGMDL